MPRPITQQEFYDLEELVDKIGVKAVTSALETICNEKADHLRVNWQDERGAKAWDALARRFDKLAAVIREV